MITQYLKKDLKNTILNKLQETKKNSKSRI
jgi:hypothetical protein